MPSGLLRRTCRASARISHHFILFVDIFVWLSLFLGGAPTLSFWIEVAERQKVPEARDITICNVWHYEYSHLSSATYPIRKICRDRWYQSMIIIIEHEYHSIRHVICSRTWETHNINSYLALARIECDSNLTVWLCPYIIFIFCR